MSSCLGLKVLDSTKRTSGGVLILTLVGDVAVKLVDGSQSSRELEDLQKGNE